jgi:hypothetical protein
MVYTKTNSGFCQNLSEQSKISSVISHLSFPQQRDGCWPFEPEMAVFSFSLPLRALAHD